MQSLLTLSNMPPPGWCSGSENAGAGAYPTGQVIVERDRGAADHRTVDTVTPAGI